jgi:hypothetical protein
MCRLEYVIERNKLVGNLSMLIRKYLRIILVSFDNLASRLASRFLSFLLHREWVCETLKHELIRMFIFLMASAEDCKRFCTGKLNFFQDCLILP